MHAELVQPHAWKPDLLESGPDSSRQAAFRSLRSSVFTAISLFLSEIQARGSSERTVIIPSDHR